MRALPPGTPFTLQFTGVAGPVAVKVCDVPRATFALLGETTNAAGDGVGVGVGVALGLGLGDGFGVGVGVGAAPTVVFPALPVPTLPHPERANTQQRVVIAPNRRNVELNSRRKPLPIGLPFQN